MFDSIQPDGDGDTTEAARNSVEKRQRDVERDADLNRDARIVELMKHCEVALTGNKEGEVKAAQKAAEHGNRGDEEDEELWGQRDPAQLLIELGALLESHPDVQRAARDPQTRQRTVVLWRSIRDRRHRAEHVNDLVQELSVYADMAESAGLIGSYIDRSKYAPVRLQALDIPGQQSRVEDGEQTPIARLRVGASEAVELDDRVVTLPLRDCRHILVVADPRQGKDSTICRIAGNLKEEHCYKWISIYDDGRDENRMIQIPSDDPGIQESLDNFGQTPKGYPTDVYIPATDIPGELPTNHKPFSVGVDELTPDILTRLAGIKPSEQTEQRISQALEDVQDGAGRVDKLIDKLTVYAEETTAEISVRRPEDDPEEDASEDIDYDEYEMSADSMLKEIVESLTIAAGQGIIRDRGADTNIDMEAVIEDQGRVAALNANHVDDSLKHLCVLIWLELIWKARGENPDLPRVALEAREIKNLAPSKLSDVKYTSIAQGLQQIFYLYSSQGSARRIMMLGSVQKIRDLYKSIRSNMDIMILLKLKSEKINEIQFSFSMEERSTIQSMQQGWGMIAGGGESDNRPSKVYPINFAGARCGLGFGDISWMARYAAASGWRVSDGTEDVGEWINGHGDRVSAEDDGEALEAGDWWLHTRDVSDYESLQDCLQDRMRDGMPETVQLHDPGAGVEEIDMELVQSVEDGDEEIDMDVPAGLEAWTSHADKVERWLTMLRVVEEHDVESYGELSELTGTSKSTIGDDMSRAVGACVSKEDGQYVLTRLGGMALDTDWTALTRA